LPAELDQVLAFMDASTDGKLYGVDAVMPAKIPAEGTAVDLNQLIPAGLQARRHVEAGVDIVVAQGYEAGGHTGEIATMVLVPEIVDAVGADVPVLAAGGIGSGRQIASALALGASGVWMGSAWLVTAEYAALSPLPSVREALLAATSSDTVRSRIYSGKPARLLKNRWTDAWQEPGAPDPLPMPLQNLLVAEAHHRLMRSGDPGVIPMPVGQIIGRTNEVVPVADLIKSLTAEFDEAVGSLR
jgi:NAD(P)H-dependent flavin oxidoreductase YrpB (nitropropane dioxygenase family)